MLLNRTARSAAYFVLLFALVPVLLAGEAPQQQPQAEPQGQAARCDALTMLKGGELAIASAVIRSATLNAPAPARSAAGPLTPATPALPEHCEVVGRANERKGVNGQPYAINFRLRLPTQWNGRFFFQGGGGTNGSVGSALGALQGQQPTVALALGYAVVSQDAGHDNTANNDPESGGTQAFGFDPRARLDFGYRSYDDVTRIAKTIIQKHYGRAPERSYYVGCSEGGREGMMLSQRFPEHFDGILSCAPGLHLPQAALAALSDSQAFAAAAREAQLFDAAGLPHLNKTFTDEDLALATGAVLTACDDLDGLKDGIVEDFTGCHVANVDPEFEKIACEGDKTPSCLTDAQLTALKSAFAATVTETGLVVYPARAWDAGIGGKVGDTFNQGWRAWKLGAYGAATNTALNITLSSTATASVFLTPPVAVAVQGGDQEAFGLSLNLDRAVNGLTNTTDLYREAAVEFMAADSTDLSAFRARGGKLLIVHGVSDPVFSVLDSIGWWNDLNAETEGKAPEFARLFAVPGMNHCGGGPSTDQFDAFSALVDWVEKGIAPERITATARPGTPWPGRTRPLCAYPKQARYNGSGSIELAENFTCR